MKKLLSAVTSAVMAASAMTSAFASLPVSAAGSLSVSQPNFSMGEVLDVSANKTASDGSVEWLIPTVTAAPGQTVTLPVVAKNSSLAVAGAQFNVDAASPIKYKSVTGGDAYTSTIGDNGKGTKFLFDDSNGIEKVAAEGATVFTLAYTIPEDCAEGTYAVKWSNGNVSDTDGFNITSKVKFTDGAIKVVKDSGEGKIDWVLDKVTGYPGETVSVKAYVSNKDNAAVAVAGAQYKIDVDAESNIKYKSFKSGGAYVSDISINESKTSFLFDHNAGLGVVAANDATIMTLTYTIPENCKPGEYPVKWSKQFVSDTDGFDLTSRINFLDGAIVVKDGTPENGQVSWVLDNVKGEKGKSVTVKAVVSDPKSSALAVAGAQFKVKTDDKNINYKSFTAGTAYPSDMSANEDKNSFMFRTSSGKAVSAANGSTILAITYDIPANCPDGVYPVSWSDAFVSDADGYNLTDNVIFKDGSITVGDVDVQDGSVSWVIPKVEGKKGEDVTLQVKVAGKGDLPVAGAQFEIAGSAPTTYKSATGKPYGEDLRSNDKQKFEFFTASGDGKTAKAGDELFTLTFSVPADCPDGVYPVSWAKQFVSDTDGFGITDKVTFVDGAIYVNTPIPVETTTTTTTVTTITTTTTTVVPVPEGGIAWQIGTKQAEPGQTVTLDIKVVDPDNNKLAIGGAQFIIENDKAVTYGTAKGSDAYKSELSTNDAIKKSLFKSETGKGIAAANDDVVATLTFTVPADCAIGKYPVNFADGTLKVFDEDGYDLSKLVEGRNGWIEVVPHVTTTLAPNQSTQTTTSTSGTGKVDTSSVSTESTQSTAPISTESTKSTSSVSTQSTQSTAPISTESTKSTSSVSTQSTAPISTESTKSTSSVSTQSTAPISTESTKSTSSVSTQSTAPISTESTKSTSSVSTQSTAPISTESTKSTSSVSTQSTAPISTESTKSTSSVSTQSTAPISTSVTTSTYDIPKGSIAWVVENGKAYPGEEVTLKVKVNDEKGVNLGIGGAQFKVSADGKVQLTKVGDKSAYGADVQFNDDIAKFLFASGTGKAHVAPDGSVVVELTYKVDADAAPGTKIPVKLTDLKVFDEDGFDISGNVLTIPGEIEVIEKPNPTETSTSTVTTTVDTTAVSTESTVPVSTESTESTAPISTQSTESTSPVSTQSTESTAPISTQSTQSTSAGTGQSTQSTSAGTGQSTQSTSPVSTQSTESTAPISTQSTQSTAPISTQSTQSTSTATGQSTQSTSTTTLNTTQQGESVTSSTNPTTGGNYEWSNTTSTSTTSTTSTTSEGYVKSYATIKTQVGYYFSHDNGQRANGEKGGFNKDQVLRLEIYDVYDNGYEVARAAVDYDLINFKDATPESEYNARTHVPKETTINDFKYDVPVYYGDMQLLDKDGKPLTVPAYIGVKGDATLDNMVDSVDASAALRYYASISTNDRDVYDVKLQSTVAGLQVESPKDELDELAAFLADVNTNEWSADNWKTKKNGRRIDSNDASKILAYYARRSSSDYDNVSNYDIWNEVLGKARFGA